MTQMMDTNTTRRSFDTERHDATQKFQIRKLHSEMEKKKKEGDDQSDTTSESGIEL